MARYSVSGVSGAPSPDCTTVDTGVAAGVYNGEPYWSWTNEAGTWYLQKSTVSTWWLILSTLGGDWTDRWWFTSGPIGSNYQPSGSYSGVVAVAEYVAPPPETFLTLQIHSGPNAGEYIVLKTR